MRVRRFAAPLASILLGVLGLTIAATAPARSMTFREVQIGEDGRCGGQCPSAIAATGQITESTPNEFLAFLQEHYGTHNLHAVVFLDSPGGRVLASMQLGTLLRQIGAAAVIAGVYPRSGGGSVMTNGQCFSACVYAFMGARKRVVPSTSLVGIHRMFVYEQDVDQDGDAYMRRRYDDGAMGAMLKRYSSSMGVSPELISVAEHIPSTNLRILSRAEIRRFRLGVSHL